MSEFELEVGALLQPSVLPFDTGYAIVVNHCPNSWGVDLYYIVTDFGNHIALPKEEIIAKYVVYGYEYNIKERIRNQIERLSTILEQLDD